MEETKLATPTIKSENMSEPFIQKWAIVFAAIVFGAALIFYGAYFDGTITKSNEKWGQFGDFLGGVVNPVIGLLTVWLPTKSLSQNQIALKQAEQALENQNQLAEHSRDYTNDVALFKQSNEAYRIFKEHQLHREAGGHSHLTDQQIIEGMQASKARMNSLMYMLHTEVERLAAKYPSPEAQE